MSEDCQTAYTTHPAVITGDDHFPLKAQPTPRKIASDSLNQKDAFAGVFLCPDLREFCKRQPIFVRTHLARNIIERVFFQVISQENIVAQ